MSDLKSLKEKMLAAQAEMATPEQVPEAPIILEKTSPVKKSAIEQQPLLFVNGKLNKADNAYINKNFFVHKGLYDEISVYCRGMDTAIFNYLLHKGLTALKEENTHADVDISEVETTY